MAISKATALPVIVVVTIVFVFVWTQYPPNWPVVTEIIKHSPQPPQEPVVSRIVEQLPENVFRDFLPHRCEMVMVGGGGGADAAKTGRIEAAWWVCKEMYEDMKRSKDCLVYGLGAGYDISFDQQLAELGCEVHSFDLQYPLEKLFPNVNTIFTPASVLPDVRSWKHNKWNWHYHLVGLSSSDDKSQNLISLPTLFSHLKHEKRIIHYFKIDIEGPEYYIMKDIEAIADRIKTFSGEWHPNLVSDKQMNINAYKSLRKMEEKGFRIFRRDVRFDFIQPGAISAMGDTDQINYLMYYPMSIMGELYFVNAKYLPK